MKSRKISCQTVALIASVALMLASCTDYKSRLGVPKQLDMKNESHVTIPSSTKEVRQVWQGGRDQISGWVKLSFDVTESCDVEDINVIDSSNENLEDIAVDMLSSWPFEAGKRDEAPIRVENLEVVMTFYTDDTITTGQVVGGAFLIVVLLPLVLLAALVSGGGSMKIGR